jgi:parallel beta-helix repeat protein
MLSFFLNSVDINIIADYYVSNTGDDNNSGSIDSPFKSIDKVNSIISSNKTIAFKRGGIYYGSIAKTNLTNIKLVAYGKGPKPILRGAKVVTSGITQNGNIYSYTDNSLPTEINNIYANGALQVIGIYQPGTYYNFPTSVAHNILIDTSLSQSDNYWNGCEVVYGANPWANIRIRVNSYLGKEFSFNTTPYYQATTSGRYFIQNHVGCLTANGQYAYNSSTKTVYVYSTVPITELIIPSVTDLFNIDYSDYINIDNLNFDICGKNQLFILRTPNLSITNCIFNNSGANAIRLYTCKSSNNTINIDNNIINNTQMCGIYTELTSNISITNNTIDKCSYIIGTEVSAINGEKAGCGIYHGENENSLIKYNTISNTSTVGISIAFAGNTTIEKNYVHKYGLRNNDLGAIYIAYNNAYYTNLVGISRHDVYINNNIINESKNGDSVSFYTSTVNNVVGIYIDDYCDGVTVSGNYIEGAYSGIEVKETNHDIFNNTIILSAGGISRFNSQYGIWGQDYGGTVYDYCMVNNNLLIINDLVSVSLILATSISGTHNIFKNNKYYIPFNNQTGNYWNVAGTSYNFYGWTVTDQTRINWDRSGELEISPSIWSNSVKPKTNYLYPIINPTKNIIIITSNDLPYSDYIDLTGIDFGISRTINPYESLILVRKEN